jgi:integrase
MGESRINAWVQRFPDRTNLVLQWFDPETGKRKSKSAETADEDEAEKARGDLEYELNHGTYRETARMSWEKFRESFEDVYLPDCRPGTRKVFQNVLNLFERICSPTSLRGVNERMVSRFVVGLRKTPGRRSKEGMMPSTIRVRLQFLHTALSWAVSQKLLPAVPSFPEVTVTEKMPQPIPAEAFERLLAKAPDAHMRAYLLCGWLSGLRRNEALYLEWEPTETAPWLDLGRNRIILPAEFVKGKKDQWVPLDPELRKVLEALPKTGKRVFRFVSSKTGEPMLPGSLSKVIVKLAKKAGVNLSMHTLRKGFGCRYASKVPAQVLQKLMRHRNIKTTMDFYANVDDAVEEAVLGPKCNSKCNTAGSQPSPLNEPLDVNPDYKTSLA